MRPATERAEETLDQVGERLGVFAATLSHRLRKAAALAREEAEDILAEAQSLRGKKAGKESAFRMMKGRKRAASRSPFLLFSSSSRNFLPYECRPCTKSRALSIACRAVCASICPNCRRQNRRGLETALRHQPGIQSAQANPDTGNVLIRFSPER